MKRLPILLLSIAGFLCASPATYADTQHCPCAAQPGIAASAAAITVPEPIVTEAVNGELDLLSLGGADATVEVGYVDINDGHTVGLRWKSNAQQYDAAPQVVSGGAKKVVFRIPNAKVAADLGLTPRVTASVGIGDNPLVISAPQDISVVSSAPPAQFPPATLPDFPGNQVDVGQLTGDLTVRVDYPSIGQGQIVQVVWEGATSEKSPLTITQDANPIELTIAHHTVLASLGKPVMLYYEVSLNGQPAQKSEPGPVYVTLKVMPESPNVADAIAGQLDLKTLHGQGAKVTFTYPGINAGHTVGIRWAGNPPYDTPHPAIGATPRPLEFTIPYTTIRQDKDKTVTLSASVGLGDGKLLLSPPLSLKIIDTRPQGEAVAAELNARYNDTRAACDDNLPSYYCNGVTTRGVANGNFDPWDPSTTQLRKGSVSVSHIRKDSNVTFLWQNSGYVLLSQNDAKAQGKDREYLCAFPHDGATDLSRGAYGCGFQGVRGAASDSANRLMQIAIRNPTLLTLFKRNEQLVDRLANGRDVSDLLPNNPLVAALLRKEPELGRLLQENLKEVEASNRATITRADLSSCAGQGAQTLNEWLTYTLRLTHRVQQCSLSTLDPAQFALTLKARGYVVQDAVYSTWNELLIKVWPAGIPAQLPLQAFYYQNAAGLPEARVYQQKYVTRTGGQWLPVIKLDPTKFNATPFSYSAADQAVQP